MSRRDRRAAPRGAQPEAGAALVAGAAEGLARLDRVVHEPARLAILAVLAVVEEADFVFVQRHAGLTAGNLAAHLTRLEEAGLVRSAKTFVERRPCTRLALTDAGRAALAVWRSSIGKLLELLPRPSRRPAAPAPPPRPARGSSG